MGVSRAERMTIHSCIQNDDTFATLIDEKSTINPYDFIAFFFGSTATPFASGAVQVERNVTGKVSSCAPCGASGSPLPAEIRQARYAGPRVLTYPAVVGGSICVIQDQDVDRL